MSSSKTKTLVMCALCVALAFLLNRITLFPMPNGGSVTPCSMFFIALAGLWFGPFYGILSGAVMGTLDVVLGGDILNPVQVLLDYILAFGALGLAGFFRNMKFGTHIGYSVGVLARFVCVLISGWVFWYQMAPGSFAASAVYNITYIGVEMILTLVIISIPAFNKAVMDVPKMLKV